jgi:hypothetical protein
MFGGVGIIILRFAQETPPPDPMSLAAPLDNPLLTEFTSKQLRMKTELESHHS